MATVELHLGRPTNGVLPVNCVLRGGWGGCEADKAAFPSPCPFSACTAQSVTLHALKAPWLLSRELKN